MKYIIIISLLFWVISCSTNKRNEMKMDNDKLMQALETIKTARIYFGHQSVGKNILAGISELIDSVQFEGIQIINISNESRDLPEYFFAHNRIGQNNYMVTKCNALGKDIHDVFQGDLDVAILKFCYVDIKEDANVEELFRQYKEWYQQFKKNYPDIKFVHMTVPLMASSGGWKIFIKRLIGYPDYTDPANIKRNQFNQMMLHEFGDEYIFDIARWEATHLDGSLNTFKNKGHTYFSLIRDYTYDGGHLNEMGRKWIAYHFLLYLAHILKN